MLLKYKIKPISPVITPFMSDTFFGHFCWALSFNKGESSLTDFLALYEDDKIAPVIFSSAFPAGFLPRPVLPPLSRKKAQDFIEKNMLKKDNNGDNKEQMFEARSQMKKWNKSQFISLEHWSEIKDNYSESALISIFHRENSKNSNFITNPNKHIKNEVSASNVINRMTGAVDASGGLFVREKRWYPENAALDIYVEVNQPEFESDVEWFLTKFLPANGFGADKNIGMGTLEICRDREFQESSIMAIKPNAKMALSLSAFDGMEKYSSFYRLKTKFGRLGGTYAVSSPTGGNPRPFKKPILMYEPGALFFTDNDLNRERLLKGVHTDEKIRHCGLPVTVGICVIF
ncbi:MAG: hypothetical protein HQK70_05195 [Desulfamplus sp.]|nr:hypothetical protein [Desulfamplus sp.]